MEKHITVENMDYMRNGFKDIDLNYPRQEVVYCVGYEMIEEIDYEPISSSKLTTKQMTDHIEFIIKFVGEVASITPKFIEEDWDRLLEQAHA